MDKSTKWMDIIVVIFSLIIVLVSGWMMAQNGAFGLALDADSKLSWHLVRSSGIVAYVLLTASTVWGLFISSQFVKDWSPGPVSLTMHSTISWMALLLGLAHGLLLMFDSYFTYTLGDIFVPFTGPYRPEAVGLGTLAFWLIILISLSFPLKKRLGHKNWKRLHYVSYIAFGLVSAHGLFAGTEGTHLGFQALVGVGVALVLILLGIRMGRDNSKADSPAPHAKREAIRS